MTLPSSSTSWSRRRSSNPPAEVGRAVFEVAFAQSSSVSSTIVQSADSPFHLYVWPFSSTKYVHCPLNSRNCMYSCPQHAMISSCVESGHYGNVLQIRRASISRSQSRYFLHGAIQVHLCPGFFFNQLLPTVSFSPPLQPFYHPCHSARQCHCTSPRLSCRVQVYHSNPQRHKSEFDNVS